MDPLFVENLIKIGMAVLVGGIVGAEREYQDKAAGFRTIILITLGSTLFTIFFVEHGPRLYANPRGSQYRDGHRFSWRRGDHP